MREEPAVDSYRKLEAGVSERCNCSLNFEVGASSATNDKILIIPRGDFVQDQNFRTQINTTILNKFRKREQLEGHWRIRRAEVVPRLSERFYR